jgi:hypothetical protein
MDQHQWLAGGEMTNEEEWRVISWAPKYQVSNFGRVRGARGWILKPIFRNTYHAVNLFPTKDRSKMENIHVLVLQAFVGPRPDGYHGCHWDGDKSNNCLGNLRWATVKENIADQKRHGTFVSGVRNGRSKLTQEQVDQIRSEYRPRQNGYGSAALAKKYGASPTTIKRILNLTSYAP